MHLIKGETMIDRGGRIQITGIKCFFMYSSSTYCYIHCCDILKPNTFMLLLLLNSFSAFMKIESAVRDWTQNWWWCCEIWYALLTSNQTPSLSLSLSLSFLWVENMYWSTLKPLWVSNCFGFRSNRTPCRCRCCRATGHLWHETEWGALMSAEVDYKTRRRSRCKVAVLWMQISARW